MKSKNVLKNLSSEKKGLLLLESIQVHKPDMTEAQIKELVQLCYDSKDISVLVADLLCLPDADIESILDVLILSSPIECVDMCHTDIYRIENWYARIKADAGDDEVLERVIHLMTGFSTMQLFSLHGTYGCVDAPCLSEKEAAEIESYVRGIGRGK